MVCLCIGNLKQSQTKQNYDENLILMESLCGDLFCIICIYTIVLAFLSAKQIHSKVAYTRSVLPSYDRRRHANKFFFSLLSLTKNYVIIFLNKKCSFQKLNYITSYFIALKITLILYAVTVFYVVCAEYFGNHLD